MKHTVRILTGVCILIFVFLFRNWIFHQEIIGGDWPYYFAEMVKEMAHLPSSWQNGYGGGLGGLSPAYFLSIYNSFFAWMSVTLGLPWTLVYKLFWFITPSILLAVGGYTLLSSILPASKKWMRIISSIILITNTYVLMIMGGGQMGVFYAISMYPWVLFAFFQLLKVTKSLWKETLILGTIFGIQLSLDPRFAYLSVISMGILYLFQDQKKDILWKRLRFGALAGVVSILLNSYWILPLLFLKENTLDSLGSAYTTVSALKFFSFADFSHALSLLHPNWPENLFGKTYFLQPEFLLLPILAFSSLLFVKKFKENTLVVGFALLGLVGAFLAKGVSEPFGFVYVWLFEHVPGFVMFRDPTKFYVLIIMSYAVLIPFTLYSITQAIKKYQTKLAWLVPVVFLFYWVILIRPAVMGSLGGTFTKREVPTQYITLKEFFQKEQGFFRTLWVPRQSRFTFTSSNHLSIEAGPLLGATDAASLKEAIKTPSVKDKLDALSIRYIIVPFDPYGEIFTDNRTYSQIKRDDIEKVLDSVPWLTKIQSSDITMYKIPQSKDHFWIENGTIIDWRKITDDYYSVDVIATGSAKLIFSENYHQGWRAHIKNLSINASKEQFGVMSFALPEMVEGRVTIEFIPRRYYLWGRWISFGTLLVVLLYLFQSRTHDK